MQLYRTLTAPHPRSNCALLPIVLLALTVLPGCRLYEFLTGTGQYSADPFLCDGCTSPSFVEPGCTTSGLPSDDASFDEQRRSPSADPMKLSPTPANEIESDLFNDAYDEDDFSNIVPDGDAGSPPPPARLEPPDADLPEREMPDAEPEYDLEFADPTRSDDPPSALDDEPMPPDPSDRVENPFPLEEPEAQPLPEPQSELDDLRLDFPDTPPSRPDDPEDKVDDLELFDDTLSPDLEFNEDLELENMDRNAAVRTPLPAGNSYYGRCLKTLPSKDSQPSSSGLRASRGRARQPFRLSESTEISPPHPGRGLFDQPSQMTDDGKPGAVKASYSRPEER